jgi:hypothetical protein
MRHAATARCADPGLPYRAAPPAPLPSARPGLLSPSLSRPARLPWPRRSVARPATVLHGGGRSGSAPPPKVGVWVGCGGLGVCDAAAARVVVLQSCMTRRSWAIPTIRPLARSPPGALFISAALRTRISTARARPSAGESAGLRRPGSAMARTRRRGGWGRAETFRFSPRQKHPGHRAALPPGRRKPVAS